MKRQMVGLLFGALVACVLFWYTTQRDELALEAWSQENGLHLKAVHLTWAGSGGPFARSPFWRGSIHHTGRGNIYRFEAVRDGETASHVYGRSSRGGTERLWSPLRRPLRVMFAWGRAIFLGRLSKVGRNDGCAMPRRARSLRESRLTMAQIIASLEEP